MRVGILGSGLMGGKLGTLLARAGHGAVFSYTRSPDKLAGPSGIRTVFPPAGGICPRSRLGGRAFRSRPIPIEQESRDDGCGNDEDYKVYDPSREALKSRTRLALRTPDD